MGNSRSLSYKRPLVTVSEEQLTDVFQNHDKDGDGKLNEAELKQAFKYLGSRCSTLRAHQAIRAIDADGDGVIGRDELNNLVQYAKKCRYGVS